MKHSIWAMSLVFTGFMASSAVLGAGPDTVRLCANEQEKFQVRDFYSKQFQGKPSAVPARELDMIESRVTSALPLEESIGAVGSPDRFREVWASIEAWGADTEIGLVLADNKVHTFNFPGLIPMTQPDDGSNIQTMYADNGDGVHMHIDRTDVALIYATRYPAKGGATRAVSFYNTKGDLTMSVLAVKAPNNGHPNAIKGFEDTWALIKSMPAACEN